MVSRRERDRINSANRRERRRQLALDTLGGKCVVCGTTENLEFDHVERSTKIAAITDMISAPIEKFLAEVAKCQLLCHYHHVEKSKTDGSFTPPVFKGADHPKSKIRREDVPAIRDMAADGKTQREIATAFGVSNAIINQVLTGKHWTVRNENG